MYVLRALFCEVVRPRYNVHIYLQNVTSARVCRCHDLSSEHIQEQRTLLNFHYIHSHIQSHSPRAPPWSSPPASCGFDLAVNQPPASLLAASFSPAGAIHQQPIHDVDDLMHRLIAMWSGVQQSVIDETIDQ